MTVCLECRAVIDECWRWCPECGSQVLERPVWSALDHWQDSFAVEWTIEATSGEVDEVADSPVRSNA